MIKRRYNLKGYPCHYCPAKFPTPQALGGHVTRVHTAADLDTIILLKKKEKKDEQQNQDH